MIERDLHFTASKSSEEVRAILMRPENAYSLVVLAHGAGAGMRHTFMTGVAQTEVSGHWRYKAVRG